MISLYLKLFFEFFKTGLFAVGGGMATLPFLYNISEKTGWFTAAQLADMVAVSESTPGPIGVNMATYVGFTSGMSIEGGNVFTGILGSLIASIGLITPSVIIILLIARALQSFRSNKYVDAAFYGLRPCSVGLIAAAGILVVKIALFNTELYAMSGQILDLINIKAIILAICVLVSTRYVKTTKKLHPIFFILASALIGIVFKF